jgi:hypothetical protein
VFHQYKLNFLFRDNFTLKKLNFYRFLNFNNKHELNQASAKIYTVNGQGTKATETSYSYDDIEKQSNYYRLKDIDFNGVENWSQIIFADCKTNTSKTEIYPNPATDYINVSTEMEDQSIMRILNLDCREVKSLPLISKQTLVDIKSLVSGVYIIEIIGKSSNKKIKLFKQ